MPTDPHVAAPQHCTHLIRPSGAPCTNPRVSGSLYCPKHKATYDLIAEARQTRAASASRPVVSVVGVGGSPRHMGQTSPPAPARRRRAPREPAAVTAVATTPPGTPSSSEPLPDIDQLLLDLEDEHNPFTFLRRVRTQTQAGDGGNCTDLFETRARFMPMFFAKCATCPQAEVDVLIAEAKQVFHVTAETMREEIDRLRDYDADAVKVAANVSDPEWLCEVVRDLTDPAHPIKYKKFIFRSADDLGSDYLGEPDLLTEVKSGAVLYQPPPSPLMEVGVISMPIRQRVTLPDGVMAVLQDVEEYGTESALLEEILEFIDSYVDIDDESYRLTAAFYVLMSWLYDKFNALPYLRAIGDSGSGKSRFLKTMKQLVYRGMAVSGATTASPIFRIISGYRGTLVFDEADFKESEMWSEVIKILNVGYEKGDYVLRSEKGGRDDKYAVEPFDPFGPKVLGTRKRFADKALENRCLTKHFMKKKVSEIDEAVPFMLDPDFYTRAQRLRNKLLLWRFRRWRHVTFDPRQRIPGLDDPRMVQVSIALLGAVESPELRARVLDFVKAHQVQLAELHQATPEARIARALVE